MSAFTFNLDLTECEAGVFNEGQRQGWEFAKSSTAKVNPYEELSFLHELFEDGFRLGEKCFRDSKLIS